MAQLKDLIVSGPSRFIGDVILTSGYYIDPFCKIEVDSNNKIIFYYNGYEKAALLNDGTLKLIGTCETQQTTLDYAECRQGDSTIAPGHAVIEKGDGTLILSTERLQRGGAIVSDTYGALLSSNDPLPIAVAGRVLAYPDADPSTFEIGTPVCTGPNGTVSQMTELEEMQYPSRIIGIVSEIPTYEYWGEKNIKVDGRIWINIK